MAEMYMASVILPYRSGEGGADGDGDVVDEEEVFAADPEATGRAKLCLNFLRESTT